MVRPSGNLIIGGTAFHTSAKVVNYIDDPAWNAHSEVCIPTKTDPMPKRFPAPGGAEYPYGNGTPLGYTRRYAARPGLGMNPGPDATRSYVKQFVVHHDGCLTADMCFSVLQNERGLSVHFLLDNDGTIYQTLDLGLMAYHASDWNPYSIGVELCNRGDATAYPGIYDAGHYGPPRGTQPCRINNHTYKSYEYTAAQNESFVQLCRELLKIFPHLPADYPQSSPGVQMWDTLPDAAIQRERYSGYIGHYHLTANKWDPGHFDFKDFCGRLRGSLCYPVFPKQEPPIDPATKQPQDKPLVPDDTSALAKDITDLYSLNESRADGGFFPVGPWGETRLWHGGVHVIGKQDGGVFAPYPGRLIAARMGRDAAIGSVNFALLRHEMTLGSTKVQFYSLYMHLANELARPEKERVAWIGKAASSIKAGQNVVWLLDEPIEAGAQIGHIGRVGPDALSRSQVHVEFFSEQFIEGVGGATGPWQLVDGTSGGRFCEAQEINGIIDANKDGVLSRDELTNFFSSGGGDQLHHFVTLHVSEWTFDPPWGDALRVPKDFKNVKPAAIDAMVADQITPGLWWDAKVAAHCRLPKDGVVYHYHPVAFMSWFKTQLIEAAIAAARTGKKIDEKDIQKVPDTITDDYHDKTGNSMRSSGDITEDPCNKSLTLEQMVQGFDAPECTP